MRFTVPQFIEYEAKIVGPLTFRQFIYVAIAGAICFVIYFTTSFSVFLLACFALGGGALAFAFLQIGGRPLSTFLFNSLKFSFSPKLYLWKKVEARIEVFKKGAIKEEVKEELPLKIAEKSQLKRIKTLLETKAK